MGRRRGTVIPFPGHQATSRADILTNKAAVKPASRAVRVLSTVCHHSTGIEFRCHHLLTKLGYAPTSAAIESRDGQSSTMERNDLMPPILGRPVLTVKDYGSSDIPGRSVLKLDMAKPQPSDEFKRTFTAGIRAARVNKGLTQIQMAKLLGIPQDHYKQYEGRTLMPHLLLAAFCHETQLNASQLLAEAGAAAARAQRRVA